MLILIIKLFIQFTFMKRTNSGGKSYYQKHVHFIFGNKLKQIKFQTMACPGKQDSKGMETNNLNYYENHNSLSIMLHNIYMYQTVKKMNI